jgi:hypothetical protein
MSRITLKDVEQVQTALSQAGLDYDNVCTLFTLKMLKIQIHIHNNHDSNSRI